MAIEILKPGKLPDSYYYGTCLNCGGEVRFEKPDAKEVFGGDQRDGPFAKIDCPTPGCGRTVVRYPRGETRLIR